MDDLLEMHQKYLWSGETITPIGEYVDIVEECERLFDRIDTLDLESKVEIINKLREALHKLSPFSSEPVDFVRWVKADSVQANDYNPNSVAPPEMELLRHSIMEDGYTQPVVSWQSGDQIEVVDGFHRNRVARECEEVQERIHGYLPIVSINSERDNRSDRIASTIRHNRARGKHQVDAMSEIVIELKNRNWTNSRIGRELGMDEDEVLRLLQITGLTEMFANEAFSKSWDVEGEVSESDFEELSDDVSTYGDLTNDFRAVNTDDEGRIFHTHESWECYQAGFYATTKEGMKKDECEQAYAEFLADIPKFADALDHVVTEWKHSCEHYLTNSAMNRIAWLGQAGACYSLGIPSTFRGGFHLLTKDQQAEADATALIYLNKWLEANSREVITMDEANSNGRQSDIY
jgi:ParB-like chromosome segregation protein Spo0J|tara:strand:+ start:1134 stop:2348 length:1215 start_codon:yes stop_codon:yes gene_type:complete